MHPLIVVALILAALAAVVHVFIFYLESLAWTGPLARKTFGFSPQDAATTKALAFNQGFYNLFLAVVVGLGVALLAAGMQLVGATLVFAGAGSMALASVVLVLSSPDKASAAAKQGILPLVAVIALAAGLAL